MDGKLRKHMVTTNTLRTSVKPFWPSCTNTHLGARSLGREILAFVDIALLSNYLQSLENLTLRICLLT